MLQSMITLLVVLMWAGAASVCRAQFTSVESAEQLVGGQRANLFATWEGSVPIDGLVVEMPAGWTLRAAKALHYGWEEVPLTVRQQSAGATTHYLVEAPRLLRGPHEFVLRVKVDGLPGSSEWSAEPFVYEDAEPVPLRGHSVRRTIQIRAAEAGRNQVLAFETGQGDPLVLSEAALPDLTAQADYTVATWLRTAGLNEVVLSTWTGDEEQPYPLEIVVDPAGRLAVYRGQPGRHESLVSRQRVADGTWHHVAVMQRSGAARAEGGWYLYLDGAVVDSLPPADVTPAPVRALAVGARLPRGEGAGREMAFSGALDDLALLPNALAQPALQRYMRRPIEPAEQGVLLTFDAALSSRLVARRTDRAARRRIERIREEEGVGLRAYLDDNDVELRWEAPLAADGEVTVERSTDGSSYEVVARMSRSDAERIDADGSAHFTWTDLGVDERVVFYRVRQQVDEDGEPESSTIKVGLGGGMEEQEMLIGNFPNPFNASTTISYELPETEQVHLAVWDLSGHQVALLVDEVETAGSHEVRFTPGELPSGTYFVRLRTPTRNDSHKMILMK